LSVLDITSGKVTSLQQQHKYLLWSRDPFVIAMLLIYCRLLERYGAE